MSDDPPPAAPLPASSNGHHPPRAQRLLIVVGVNEGEAGLTGWHARTRDGRCGLAMRPAEPQAFWTLRLPEPWRKPIGGGVALRALLCGAPSVLKQPVRARLMFAASGGTWREAAQWRFGSDNWCWREAFFGPGDLAGSEKLRLRLDTEPLLIPAKHLGNRDYREMGVQWGALRLFPKEDLA